MGAVGHGIPGKKSDSARDRLTGGSRRKTDEKNGKRKGKGQAAVKHGLSR